jgi:ankyrin repeat protein/L-ascorbate metabolism protein UlaG (beta-lactamase superfamily)
MDNPAKRLIMGAALCVTVFLGTRVAPGRPAAEGPDRPLNVLVLLGEWFGDAYFPLKTEIEARGWTMKRVGLDGEYRGCYNKKRDVVLRSDIVIQDKMDLSGFDALIIPSGPQWRKFNENPPVLAFVRNAHAAGLIVASFCVGNTTVKAAGLVDLPSGPELYPAKVTLVKERVLLGPRGGGPPPGDGFESAPVKEICDAVARELAGKKAAAVPAAGQIHEAVRAGDLAKVKALVAKDPQVVNEKDARGRTPLHFASVIGKPDILAFLIAGGADVRAADPGGFTPLHWAAAEGQADAARALIAAGADPNALSPQGVSTLESAFYGRHPEAVEALLQGGLKIETAGDAGASLLHRAASAGFLSLVEHLLKNGADPASTNVYGGTLLHSAASGGLTSMIEKLAAAGANINAADDVGQTPLHLAAAAGHKDLVDTLISKGANLKAVCRDGRTLMHCAAMGGLVDLMGRLADAGFAVDAADRYGRTPLLKAAEAGSDKAAEFLLSRGANVMSRDSFQQTALHEATFSGNLALLDLLVKRGADIDALNKEGSTPLLYVTQAGREEVIEWLIAHGAKLNVRNKYNETPLTFPLGNGFVGLAEKLWPRAEALKDKDLLEKYPLHRAAYLGVTGAVSFALNKGVPTDAKDESGRTPFQRAAQGGNVEIAQMLLSKGAAVDAPDPQGSTPLHLAVKKGRRDMVRLLLEKGAAVAAKDGRGRTPLELAAEYGYPDIADVLVQAGAAPKPGEAPPDVRSILARPLKDGQAVVWALGHCGFAVKTRSRLLIFDYFSRGGPRPAKPSLANGFVDPEEIKDQDVTVFVSHSHGDHFDQVILGWRSVVKNIRYVFGWNARKGERTMDMPAPRPTASLDGLEIFTVNGEHNDVPETAYLVKADGLSIYHAGDYISPMAAFKADMDYLRGKAGRVDLAFVSQFEQAEALAPAVVFPMHAYNREFMYETFAREAAEKKLPFRVICPENKGDRFQFSF